MSDGKYRPIVGDRVRVILEGPVTRDYRYQEEDDDPDLGFDIGTILLAHDDVVEHVVSVEKIEPPVEVFGPGSIVRSKHYPNSTYTVGNAGWLSHQTGDWCETHHAGKIFTSEDYERVVLQ